DEEQRRNCSFQQFPSGKEIKGYLLRQSSLMYLKARCTPLSLNLTFNFFTERGIRERVLGLGLHPRPTPKLQEMILLFF
ncbi:MAG: hypothetical protein ACOC1P_05200, partial [Minisyncoccales bacterium]